MNEQFRMFYDGACPICRREVAWLKRRDRNGNLEAEDIAASGFDPARYGLTHDEITRVLHGVRPDGVVVRGMEAVRESYRSVGLGWLLALTRLPGLRFLSDLIYGWFARNRVALGRFWEPARSDGRCGAPP